MKTAQSQPERIMARVHPTEVRLARLFTILGIVSVTVICGASAVLILLIPDPGDLLALPEGKKILLLFGAIATITTAFIAWAAYYLKRLPHIGLTLDSDSLTCTSAFKSVRIPVHEIGEIRISFTGRIPTTSVAWRKGTLTIRATLTDPKNTGSYPTIHKAPAQGLQHLEHVLLQRNPGIRFVR